MAIEAEKKKFAFYGTGGTLLGMHLVNLFLALITLGIYFFWGRVKIRKYTWGQIEFEGDRLSYHGTGKETFLGWLKAMVFFGAPYFLLRYMPRLAGLGPIEIGVGAMLSSFLIIVFIPMATVGSRRYRLSRTAWRGIRFSFRKTWGDFVPLFLKGIFLRILTLGLYSPYYDAQRDKFLVSNTYVGNRKLDYDGEGEDLFKLFIPCYLLFIFTLGISILWYEIKKQRYLWNHTTFGDARFECTITVGGMLSLYFVNTLLVLFTLGFAYPWAQVRSMNYLLKNLTLNGTTNLGSIEQEAQTVNATGEELASFLDLDFDLG
jgi:uncharacterized membrane protein YjgN (DUF898 family)